jgi:hypothetical protein
MVAKRRYLMGEKTRLGLWILGAALVLGALGDALLRATPWGVNFFLWILALIGAAVAVAWRGRSPLAGEGRWLIFTAVFFSGGLVWRDSPVVAALDVLAVLMALALAVARGKSGGLRRAGLSEYLIGSAYAGALASAGPAPMAIRDIAWSEVARGGWREPVLAVTRGVLIAAPLVLVFGALFVAADAVFENLVLNVFGFDVAKVLGHLLIFTVCAWITSGLLWAALMTRGSDRFAFDRPRTLSLGIVEIGVVFSLLDVLFVVFIAVQVRYLFGGAATVSATAGLTYAEYARHGFFELVVVTALALPLLLLAHWMLHAEGRAHRWIFTALAVMLAVLLLVVVASALERMYLYTTRFGLTELRLYTTVFMIWISIVLLWFAATVLRGARERFAFGALISGFAVIFLINAMNPDVLIVRANIARMQEGKEFDPYYVDSLSADAVPVLVDALPKMNHTGRKVVEDALRNRWLDPKEKDWRTWNTARAAAHRTTRSYSSTISNHAN